jgi:hypothetical protein
MFKLRHHVKFTSEWELRNGRFFGAKGEVTFEALKGNYKINIG